MSGPVIRSEPGRRPFWNQLGPNDLDVSRSVDSQSDLSALEPDDRHANVIANEQPFHQLAGQDQHVFRPLKYAQVCFRPTIPFIGQFDSRAFREEGAHDEPSSN